MKSSPKAKLPASTRQWTRVDSLKELFLLREGSQVVLSVRAPDISPRGMFINTPTVFPEGTVLKVGFRLARSNRPIKTRCEVRYCLAGVGVGVEFIGIAPGDEKAIRTEVSTSTKTKARKKSSRARA